MKIQRPLVCLSIHCALAFGGWQTALGADKTTAELAAAGDAEAQFLLGRNWLRGEGVPRDYAQAFSSMRKAAAQGHAEAEAGLGFMYSSGLGVAQDDAEAVTWLRKAADKGVAKAQFNLGRMLLAGRGVAKDENEAFEWIQRAAEQGVVEALVAQGEALYFGESGQPQDYGRAFALLLKAAEAGNANAQNTVGTMLRDAKGAKSNWKEAEAWFRKAAGQDHAKAQSNLGLLLAGQPKEDRAAKIEALKWLMVADLRGEITAKKALDEILEKTPAEDAAEARRQAAELRKAAKPAVIP